MPTGYTTIIGEKNITFKEFALRCARAFGATIDIRDEPLDVPIPEFQPSNYYENEKKYAQERLEKYTNISHKELLAEMENSYNEEYKSTERSIQKDKDLKEKYIEMLLQVIEWKVPSEDHRELREFMLRQITESIKYDCGLTHTFPKKISIQSYRKMKIAQAKKEVDYFIKEQDKEIERVNEQNLWVKQLKESLK